MWGSMFKGFQRGLDVSADVTATCGINDTICLISGTHPLMRWFILFEGAPKRLSVKAVQGVQAQTYGCHHQT